MTASSLIPSTLQVFNLVSTTSCSNIPLHHLLPQNLLSLARLSTTRRSSFRLHQLLQQLLHRLTTSPNHIQATAFRFTTHADFITTLHDACRALRSSLNFSNEPPVTTSSSQSLVTVFKLCRTSYNTTSSAEVYDVGRLLDTKFDITAICSLSYMELFQHFNTSAIRSRLPATRGGFSYTAARFPTSIRKKRFFDQQSLRLISTVFSLIWSHFTPAKGVAASIPLPDPRTRSRAFSRILRVPPDKIPDPESTRNCAQKSNCSKLSAFTLQDMFSNSTWFPGPNSNSSSLEKSLKLLQLTSS